MAQTKFTVSGPMVRVDEEVEEEAVGNGSVRREESNRQVGGKWHANYTGF